MRYDEEFHALAPKDKGARQNELLTDPEIEAGWADYRHEIEIASAYFSGSNAYTL